MKEFMSLPFILIAQIGTLVNHSHIKKEQKGSFLIIEVQKWLSVVGALWIEKKKFESCPTSCMCHRKNFSLLSLIVLRT